MVEITKNNYFKNNIRAYFKEAVLAFTIDFVILGVLWILYFSYIYEEMQSIFPLIIMTTGYFISTTLLHYRIAVLAFIDIKKSDMVKQKVKLCNLKGENSWSGWLGYSNVAKFYPKNKLVDRYRIYYFSKANGNKFVRLIMSIDKRKKIHETFFVDNTLENIEICYLRRSKVLVSFNLLTDQKYHKNIEKAINQLNNMI